MRTIAKQKGIGVTDEGINSLAYQVAQSGEGAASSLSFKEYLRMVDMGAGRGHPLGGLKSTLVTLKSRNKSGLVQSKDNVRPAKTYLYSKTVYGNITGLQNELLFGYTEEVIEMMKKEFNQPATSN